jgi:hypothetical protein
MRKGRKERYKKIRNTDRKAQIHYMYTSKRLEKPSAS